MYFIISGSNERGEVEGPCKAADLAETALQGSETREERKRTTSDGVQVTKSKLKKIESVGRPANETMSHLVRVVLIDITVRVR